LRAKERAERFKKIQKMASLLSEDLKRFKTNKSFQKIEYVSWTSRRPAIKSEIQAHETHSI
jgi:inorganic pyrophosphatase/exopolyphosphatase